MAIDFPEILRHVKHTKKTGHLAQRSKKPEEFGNMPVVSSK
jgi:hypothetical protein